MPTYQYKCEECGIVFERFQHFSDDPIKVCPECNGAVRRVIQPVGIIFKGKGFYVTDNKGDTSALMPKPDKEAEAKPSSKDEGESAKPVFSEAKSSEAKPSEAKPAPKAD